MMRRAMTTAVHLDTSALRFYQDAPDNYCHFVLGNLFEVFVGLSESGVVEADLDLTTHNDVLSKFEPLYSVFTPRPLRRLLTRAEAAREISLTPTVNWSTLESTRDFGHYLKGFQSFIWSRLNIRPAAPANQVTLIRRNRVASNRYVINEAQLTGQLEADCARRGVAFEVVDFEGMPFERQVELMSRTSVLIGIHGAGLVNAMFLPPGAAVIELMPHREFESFFFRWTGVSKGHVWVRLLEPSWSVPSLYNLFLACTREGHTRRNRFFRDRNAVFEPESVSRALSYALRDAGLPASGLEVDVTLEPEERRLWRKLALLRTHRKFLLGLALACLVVATSPLPAVGAIAAVVLAALGFFV